MTSSPFPPLSVNPAGNFNDIWCLLSYSLKTKFAEQRTKVRNMILGILTDLLEPTLGLESEKVDLGLIYN